jgi:hypothetical protein
LRFFRGSEEERDEKAQAIHGKIMAENFSEFIKIIHAQFEKPNNPKQNMHLKNYT